MMHIVHFGSSKRYLCKALKLKTSIKVPLHICCTAKSRQRCAMPDDYEFAPVSLFVDFDEFLPPQPNSILDTSLRNGSTPMYCIYFVSPRSQCKQCCPSRLQSLTGRFFAPFSSPPPKRCLIWGISSSETYLTFSLYTIVVGLFPANLKLLVTLMVLLLGLCRRMDSYTDGDGLKEC